MTDDELKAIEWRRTPLTEREAADLVAEVRRLTTLVKHAEWAADDAWNGESMGAVCPWCQNSKSRGHAPDCPAFAPDGAVR